MRRLWGSQVDGLIQARRVKNPDDARCIQTENPIQQSSVKELTSVRTEVLDVGVLVGITRNTRGECIGRQERWAAVKRSALETPEDPDTSVKRRNERAQLRDSDAQYRDSKR